MDNKKLGLILLILGIILAITIQMVKVKEDAIIRKIVDEQGSCFLKDGTCLHDDRSLTFHFLGWFFSALTSALGLYLLFFDKSQKAILSTLEHQKHIQIEGEKFDILLKGIKAVKEQDGITQQTLRLRTDMHKSKLSIVLDGLEKKGLVTRKEKGKTKQVFLKINI
jgi:DNA-binding MarR family transcriptional regulator